MSKMKFLIEGIKNFKEVGTVTRSGTAMCQKMVSYLDQDSKHILELGAGDGVITRHILEKMPADGKLISFEINPNLFKQLESIDDDRLIAVNDSAENLEEYLRKHDMQELDAILSAIPFLVLPQETADRILTLCKKSLKKGGPFTQVHYGKGLKDFYESVFGNIVIHFILMNVPPAYVFYCKR